MDSAHALTAKRGTDDSYVNRFSVGPRERQLEVYPCGFSVQPPLETVAKDFVMIGSEEIEYGSSDRILVPSLSSEGNRRRIREHDSMVLNNQQCVWRRFHQTTVDVHGPIESKREKGKGKREKRQR